jgi:hypothetical protein
MEFFIVFGIVAVPLFLLGLFAVYKVRKANRKEQQASAQAPGAKFAKYRGNLSTLHIAPPYASSLITSLRIVRTCPGLRRERRGVIHQQGTQR